MQVEVKPRDPQALLSDYHRDRETPERRMRVLQFAPRVCWPLDTGAKLRNYHLARVLADRASVTLLAFADRVQPLSNLEAFFDRVITVPKEPAYTFAKIVRGVVGRTPLPVLNYTTDAMKQALAQALDEGDFDIVQVESIHLMAYLPIIRAARNRPVVVCDWHNIESELMQRYSVREANPLRRTYARATARKMNALERRAIKEFDAHVAVSQRDAAELLKLDARAQVFVVENGVDADHYADKQIEKAHTAWMVNGGSSPRRTDRELVRHRIVFVGSMDYHANIDAAVSFARDVWLRVSKQKPELVFTIVGRDPGPRVRELASLPGVEVTGTVDDVRPYYREALAAVVPLRVGGGSRLKILEAMAAGVPVISTTLGAEGLAPSADHNLLIADSDEQLSAAISEMTENRQLREQLRARGRAFVSERYHWMTLGARLFQNHQRLCDAKSARIFT